MKTEITRLAREYTQETANLKDYQCQTKSAIYGRQLARRWMESDGYTKGTIAQLSNLPKEIGIEETNPDDSTEYIWALVPEYNSYGHAKVFFRRVGTADGELLLPPEKRIEKRIKISEKEEEKIKARLKKSILEKIRNYEGQIKKERLRLMEQIRQNDKVYMEASAIEIKRLCDKLNDTMDDFLDMLAHS